MSSAWSLMLTRRSFKRASSTSSSVSSQDTGPTTPTTPCRALKLTYRKGMGCQENVNVIATTPSCIKQQSVAVNQGDDETRRSAFRSRFSFQRGELFRNTGREIE